MIGVERVSASYLIEFISSCCLDAVTGSGIIRSRKLRNKLRFSVMRNIEFEAFSIEAKVITKNCHTSLIKYKAIDPYWCVVVS